MRERRAKPLRSIDFFSCAEIGTMPVMRYLLGVHPNWPPYPSEDTEYSPTFYPGTRDRDLATVIEMNEGQKSELKDFV
jgi:hypothetical protein